jgi:predicted RNase H-like HicB family nuclease
MKAKTPTEPLAATPYIFRISVEPDEDRYCAEVPALPGCHSWGYSYEEAVKNIKQAVELWIEVKREAGEPIPLEPADAIRRAKLTPFP